MYLNDLTTAVSWQLLSGINSKKLPFRLDLLATMNCFSHVAADVLNSGKHSYDSTVIIKKKDVQVAI